MKVFNRSTWFDCLDCERNSFEKILIRWLMEKQMEFSKPTASLHVLHIGQLSNGNTQKSRDLTPTLSITKNRNSVIKTQLSSGGSARKYDVISTCAYQELKGGSIRGHQQRYMVAFSPSSLTANFLNTWQTGFDTEIPTEKGLHNPVWHRQARALPEGMLFL